MGVEQVTELIPQPAVGLKSNGFAQFGDPMSPGCCRWCGDVLGAVKAERAFGRPEYKDARGDYGDNTFCGLRCGYEFGLRLAVLGSRLRLAAPKPRVPAEPAP